MPSISMGDVSVDYIIEGQGEVVVLVHSSLNGNRQWAALTKDLRNRYCVVAPNLYGYGSTSCWPAGLPQTLQAQADLVLGVCEGMASSPVHLVGHSYGGAVVLKAALQLGDRLGKIVLLEPTPFTVLKQNGVLDAFNESWTLREDIRVHLARDEWLEAAKRVANYWIGAGTWDGMSEKRRNAFAKALRPYNDEWDSLLLDETPVSAWRELSQTMVLSDCGTCRPVREIVRLLESNCPHWYFKEVNAGGHMAPLRRPDLVNPLVCDFLDGANRRV